MTTVSHVTFKSPLPLIPLISRPIRRVAVSNGHNIKECGSITLKHGEHDGVEISSQMHDVAEQLEVGVLRFEPVSEVTFNSQNVDLPSELVPKRIWKLVIEEAGTVLESGLRFVFTNDQDLVILPADFPNQLSIQGNAIPVINPTSEYKFEEYKAILIFDSALEQGN